MNGKKCIYCGREDEGNASDYYHFKQCKADALRKQIEQCTDLSELRRLRTRLEAALYVGD